MYSRVRLLVWWVAASLVSIGTAEAAIIFEDLGTNAPPALLGGYTTSPFGLDPRPLFSSVTDVPMPGGEALTLDQPLSHRRVLSGWATWSHGYLGDVYYQPTRAELHGFPYSIGLALPSNVLAFYFYVEPDSFGEFEITAIDQLGRSYTRSANGNAGARGFGFYATDGDVLSSVIVGSREDFAVGEFGVSRPLSVPEPATLTLLGLGFLAAVRRRAHRAARMPAAGTTRAASTPTA